MRDASLIIVMKCSLFLFLLLVIVVVVHGVYDIFAAVVVLIINCKVWSKLCQ